MSKQLRRLGLLGGMSWQSTAVYYRLLNEGVSRALGGLHSAELLIDSADLAPLAELQHAGDWLAIGGDLARRAAALQAAGAEALLIGTNTMHLVADQIAAALSIPVIDLIDEVGRVANGSGWRRLGLLGTRFTMQSPELYPARLAAREIAVETPDEDDQALIHRVIYAELCNGEVHAASREAYLQVVERLADRGCDAVILGCTEIGLLLDEDCGSPVPLIDSAAVHAEAGVAFALGR